MAKIKRALISVSDKKGVVDFAKGCPATMSLFSLREGLPNH